MISSVRQIRRLPLSIFVLCVATLFVIGFLCLSKDQTTLKDQVLSLKHRIVNVAPAESGRVLLGLRSRGRSNTWTKSYSPKTSVGSEPKGKTFFGKKSFDKTPVGFEPIKKNLYDKKQTTKTFSPITKGKKLEFSTITTSKNERDKIIKTLKLGWSKEAPQRVTAQRQQKTLRTRKEDNVQKDKETPSSEVQSGSSQSAGPQVDNVHKDNQNPTHKVGTSQDKEKRTPQIESAGPEQKKSQDMDYRREKDGFDREQKANEQKAQERQKLMDNKHQMEMDAQHARNEDGTQRMEHDQAAAERRQQGIQIFGEQMMQHRQQNQDMQLQTAQLEVDKMSMENENILSTKQLEQEGEMFFAENALQARQMDNDKCQQLIQQFLEAEMQRAEAKMQGKQIALEKLQITESFRVEDKQLDLETIRVDHEQLNVQQQMDLEELQITIQEQESLHRQKIEDQDQQNSNNNNDLENKQTELEIAKLQIQANREKAQFAQGIDVQQEEGGESGGRSGYGGGYRRLLSVEDFARHLLTAVAVPSTPPPSPTDPIFDQDECLRAFIAGPDNSDSEQDPFSQNGASSKTPDSVTPPLVSEFGSLEPLSTAPCVDHTQCSNGEYCTVASVCESQLSCRNELSVTGSCIIRGSVCSSDSDCADEEHCSDLHRCEATITLKNTLLGHLPSSQNDWDDVFTSSSKSTPEDNHDSLLVFEHGDEDGWEEGSDGEGDDENTWVDDGDYDESCESHLDCFEDEFCSANSMCLRGTCQNHNSVDGECPISD